MSRRFVSWDDFEFPAAEFADDFDARIFFADPQLFTAVGALAVVGFDDRCRIGDIDQKTSFAVLATDHLTDVLRINPQFLRAMRTEQIHAARCHFHFAIQFLHGNELRDFDAILLQIGIQQRPAIDTMDDTRGRVFATRRAGATRPFGHFLNL